MQIAEADNKLSLGSTAFEFTTSTFWMVLFYGFFINLNNFGMDQNYVQRYHTATSQKQAAKSVWLCVILYVPASLLFFIIGTALFTFYQVHPIGQPGQRRRNYFAGGQFAAGRLWR